MRRIAFLILIVACGGTDPIEPPPPESFHVVVVGYPHNWTSYMCTVHVAMEPEDGRAATVDSVAVGAGVQDSVTFSLPPGRYIAGTVLRWKGTPNGWELESEPLAEEHRVTVPGTHRIDCP